MSKSNSNSNISNINPNDNQLNINTNDINNNDNNSNTPLKKVYSNMTSSNQSRKLSSLEEKLSTINTQPNIENYYKSLKNENQEIIPQVRRMELLQRKMNLLQNTSNQNSKALQEILELEMKERIRYPKYTIIQNTPLTPHEEMINEILKKKFGPNQVYSMNYPTVVFKNQEEINEMKNNQNNNSTNNNKNNYNNNTVGTTVTFQSNENRPITIKMLKEIQQEILHLRKTLSELKIGFKEIKEQMKLKNNENEHKNSLMIEMIRKTIEDGGDNKLKASMTSVFDRKKVNLNDVKTELDIFKEKELVNFIKNEIKIYDEEKEKAIDRQFEELKNEIKAINIPKFENFEDFLKNEEKEKKESQKMSNKTSIKEKEKDKNNEKNEEEEDEMEEESD